MKLSSISPINKVYDTAGCAPVKVMCSDLNDYVCKYATGVPTRTLYNEFVAAEFLTRWGIDKPKHNIISIKEEHFPESVRSARVQLRYFSRPCFGSKHELYAKEIDPSFPNLDINKKVLGAIENKFDLLKIGLFDLWLANEDRNHNNYNLLLNPTETGYCFLPIDHERCFNGSSARVDRPIVLLTEDESLITSPLAQVLLRGSRGLSEKIDEMASEYYLWVSGCQKGLDDALKDLPEAWGIDVQAEIEFMQGTLFTESWLSECVEGFKDYAKKYLIK